MSRPTPNAVRTWLTWLVTAAAFVLLAARQRAFVRDYAVDVMCWDAWALYQPMFDGRGWWAMFDRQHGPHRQGVGGLVLRATATLTRWDSRADAAAVSWTLILAVPLGAAVAWRCGVRGPALAGVPVLVLNIRQYQQLEVAANPAHGAVPLLLLFAWGLAWFARRPAVRLTLVAGLTGLLIFTGFGLFAGLVAPPLLLAEMIAARRSGDGRRAVACGVATAAVAAAWGAFAVGYVPDPGSGRFRFPVEHPADYLRFTGTLLANAVGATWLPGDPGPAAVAVGLTLAAAGVAVCVARGRRVWRAGVAGDPAGVAVFALAAYGVLFAAFAAVGRTPEGWPRAAEPRYVPLCVPTVLAVVVHLATDRRRWARWAAVALVAAVAVGTFDLHDGDRRFATRLRNAPVLWRRAYLATGDEAAANRLAPPVYPRQELASRLDYLRRHQLNLFDPTVYKPTPPAAKPQPVSR